MISSVSGNSQLRTVAGGEQMELLYFNVCSFLASLVLLSLPLPLPPLLLAGLWGLTDP